MSELFSIFIGLALINNIVLVQFLGLCPVFGVSKKLGPAVNMGLAVTLVIFISSALAWLANNFILIPLNAEYLHLIVYLLIIGSMVQILEIFLKRSNGRLYKSFGIYLALIAANCAVIGVLLLNADESYNFIESLAAAIGAGAGFTLVMALMSGIREKLELSNIPKAMKGLPVIFITAALLALAFSGFAGMAF
jgi:electron transport complex protein RnfA